MKLTSKKINSRNFPDMHPLAISIILRLILFSFGSIFLDLNSASAQGAAGDSWSKVQTNRGGTLSVVYYPQPGLIYKENNASLPTGVCVEILSDFKSYVRQKYKLEITIRYADEVPVFKNFIEIISVDQNVLGVSNITITPERRKTLDFTPPFLSNPVVLVTHKDAPAIKNINEIKTTLAGYKAEVVSGSTFMVYFERIKWDIGNIDIAFEKSGGLIMDHIAVNPRLITIVDLTEFIYAVRKKLPLKWHSVKINDEVEQLGFAMKKGTDWIPIWTEFMTDEYINSAAYRKHIVNHLGSSFLTFTTQIKNKQ